MAPEQELAGAALTASWRSRVAQLSFVYGGRVRTCLIAAGITLVAASCSCKSATGVVDQERSASPVTSSPRRIPSAAKTTAPENWLASRLRAGDVRFQAWLDSAADLRLQILVTTVTPTEHGPRFESHGFRVDQEYVYPASTIKVFVAVATLRGLAAVGGGTELGTATRIERCRANRSGCEPPEADRGAGPLAIGSEIDKLLRYSDDVSFDRLFDILGHNELNQAVKAMGFSSVRIHHRLEVDPSWGRKMRRIRLHPSSGPVLELPERTSTLELAPTPAKKLMLGKAHVTPRGRVDKPMSFAAKNYVSLPDMQRMSISLLFPDSARAADLGLIDAHRELIIASMTGQLAGAEMFKPLLPGVLKVLPGARIRYVNKTGIAYGFRLDNAYIEDRESKRGMFVTVSIYVNPNGVLNDDDYAYDATAHPFLAALGEVLTREVLLSKSAGPR